MSQSTELAIRQPGEQRLRLADSLESAQVGEVVVLDKKGQVMAPGRARREFGKQWLLVSLIGLAGWGAVATAGGPLLIGGAFFVSCLGLFGIEMRRSKSLRQAIALAASGERDRAIVAFEALDGRRHNPSLRATIHYWLGTLYWQRGDRDAAAERYEKSAELCERSKHLATTRWIVDFARAQLFAVQKKIRKAETVRALLDDAPAGNYFHMARITTDLTIAFHKGDSDAALDLGSADDDLYDWAKEALSMNRFGQTVVLLSWAFEARGDMEMAVLLLDEAPSRLRASFMEEADPELHAWMVEAAKRFRGEARDLL